MIDFDLHHAQAVADIVRGVTAEHVMPYFRAPERICIREKTGPEDLVTAADEACERALSAALCAFLPGSGVLGEEAASADPAVFEKLNAAEPVWIIDPVDGTNNFARGTPVFAVLVALCVADVTIAGWIFDPNGERMSLAVNGAGCFTNGVRILPPRDDDQVVDAAAISAAISGRYCTPDIGRQIRKRAKGLKSAHGVGSAGQEYLYLLDGDLHASMYHRLMPWDHAAGVLLFAEAGGYSALVESDAPYSPLTAMRSGGTLLNAVNRPTWLALRDYLFN